MIDIRAMHRGSSRSTVFVFYNFDHPFSIGVVNIDRDETLWSMHSGHNSAQLRLPAQRCVRTRT